MSEVSDLYDQLVLAAPRLRAWRRSVEENPDTPWSHYSDLAKELAELVQAEGVAALTPLAPILEQLLAEHDDREHISIGLIEDFQDEVEDRGLDSPSIRRALGPLTQRTWESLYQYRHQLHHCQIDFDTRHLAGPVRTPARLERWTHTKGAHVPKGASLARIQVEEASYELRLAFGCYAGKRAPADGQVLRLRDMLLVVLPDTDAHVRPSLPYGTLTAG